MTFATDAQNVLFTSKYPTEAVVRYIDYSDRLILATGSSDVIASSIWTGQTGITISNSSFDTVNGTAQALFSGGTAGQTFKITNTITTTGGQTLVQPFELRVKQP
jgi:hypothetical protein